MDSTVVIEVTVIKAFKPFTLSQALLVELVRDHCVFLPLRFVVKLLDPRFTEPPWQGGLSIKAGGWSRDVDRRFRDQNEHNQ